MQHILGHAAFEIPSHLRDDTSYVYGSSNEEWMLRVTPMPEAKEAPVALEKAKAAFEEFYGPFIIYSKATQIRSAARGAIPAYEGELTDPTTGKPTRFGIVALAEQGTIVVFLMLGPRTLLLPELGRVIESVHFLVGVGRFDPAHWPTTGSMTRYQADGVSFELLAAWIHPTSLLFVDEKADDLVLAFTLDDAMVAEGTMEPSEQIPIVSGEEVTVTRRLVTPGRPGPQSWTGELTVERRTAQRTETLELRKASAPLGFGEVLTVRGKSLQKNAPALTFAWEMMLQTVHGWPP